jgi:arylsulfatase B
MVPLLVSLLGLAGAASGARTVKPHILMILADDYGWSDVGYHVNAPGYPSTAAQKKEATTATPYIDSLVKEGVELDQAYVFKYCSPTRCSLQSGRNPIHANVMNIDPTNHNPANPVGGFSALARNLTGIGSVMQRAGYSTAFAGKWDVGMATPDHTPRGRGYDQSLHYFHHTNE